MIKTLPDSHIRKAIYEAINGISVNGKVIPCFDSRVSTVGNREIPNTYTVMTTQSNEVDKSNKCAWNWESEILIEVYDGVFSAGNTVSRYMADNVLDMVRALTCDLELDVASGLSIITVNQSFPNDIVVTSKNQNVVRKFIRLNLLIQ